MRTHYPALIGLFVFICTGAWWWMHPSPHLPTMAEPMLNHDGDLIRVRANSPLSQRIHVAPVQTVSLPHSIDLPAQLITPANQTFPIYTPVTGRITAINVQAGQKIQKGDVLATVLSGDMVQALADNEKAQAALHLTQNAYHRANAVLVAGGNAVKDQQTAYNDLVQAKSEATRAQRHLQALSADQFYNNSPLLTITAPDSGIVSSISFGVGQNIVDVTNALMTITDVKEVWLSASVPENILPLLHPNMTLQARFENQTCAGPVTSQDPSLHSDTRRLNLYLRCDNQQGLLYPGQYTTASLMIPQRKQVILPKTALFMNNDTVSVFVETATNSYRRRIINISYDEGDSVRVLSGIKAGEHVVTSGAILLNDY